MILLLIRKTLANSFAESSICSNILCAVNTTNRSGYSLLNQSSGDACLGTNSFWSRCRGLLSPRFHTCLRARPLCPQSWSFPRKKCEQPGQKWVWFFLSLPQIQPASLGTRQGPPEEHLVCAAVPGLYRVLMLRCIEGLAKGALDNEGLPGLAASSVSAPEAAHWWKIHSRGTHGHHNWRGRQKGCLSPAVQLDQKETRSMALALCLVAALEPAASMQTSQCVPEGVEPVLTGPEPPMVLPSCGAWCFLGYFAWLFWRCDVLNKIILVSDHKSIKFNLQFDFLEILKPPNFYLSSSFKNFGQFHEKERKKKIRWLKNKWELNWTEQMGNTKDRDGQLWKTWECWHEETKEACPKLTGQPAGINRWSSKHA